MARPKKIIDMCDVAIKNGVPWWIASELGVFSSDQVEKIKTHANRKNECQYLCELFPDLKNKIKYRYTVQKDRSNRSMFRDRLRTLLRNNLEKNNVVVRSLTESMIEFLLGYSVDDLMGHIKNQFTANMSWEGHGDVWQIDHIYPCSKLKYTSVHHSNFKKLWCFANLRPLCKIKNRIKSDNIERSGENGQKRTKL